MVIDSYIAGRIYSLRQKLQADEKIVVKYGCILEVGKKTWWERLKERIWQRKP